MRFSLEVKPKGSKNIGFWHTFDTGSPPALAISPTFASADFTEAGALKIAYFLF
jgi:hypothetical protein